MLQKELIEKNILDWASKYVTGPRNLRGRKSDIVLTEDNISKKTVSQLSTLNNKYSLKKDKYGQYIEIAVGKEGDYVIKADPFLVIHALQYFSWYGNVSKTKNTNGEPTYKKYPAAYYCFYKNTQNRRIIFIGPIVGGEKFRYISFLDDDTWNFRSSNLVLSEYARRKSSSGMYKRYKHHIFIYRKEGDKDNFYVFMERPGLNKHVFATEQEAIDYCKTYCRKMGYKQEYIMYEK